MHRLHTKIIVALIVFCLFIVSFISWRWLFITHINLELVDIHITENTNEHPLDKLLQENLSYLQSKSQFAKFFARPSSITFVPNLWVNQCEVTQKEFGQFRQWYATREQRPQIAHFSEPPNWKYHSKTVGHKLLGRLNMPVSGVSYLDAYAYCRASGGRLPYTNEFEAISNGMQGNLFPWGNTVDKKVLNKAMPFRDPTLNVQACGKSDLPTLKNNVYDIGNNLSEWVTQKNNKPALMGGNAFNRPFKLHALNLIIRPAPTDYRSQYVGFRCVYPKPAHINADVQHQTPWKSISNLMIVDQGYYPIGTPPDSRIVQMLKHLKPKQYRHISALPIKQTPLDLKVTRTEITISQYAKFLSDPLVKLNFFNHPKHPEKINHTPVNWKKQKTNPSDPVTNLTWWSAWAFAKWIGGRLPTDREWKKIAGARTTLYPWGNQYAIGLSIDRNHPGSDNKKRSANLSSDDSLHGVLGLSGNVSEWTSSVTHYGDGFHIIVKGGSFELPEQATQVMQTAAVSPNYHNSDLGFRVVFPR